MFVKIIQRSPTRFLVKDEKQLPAERTINEGIAEEYTVISSNKNMAGDQTVVDIPMISNTISPMCTVAEEMITDNCLVEVVPIPSPQQMTCFTHLMVNPANRNHTLTA